MPSIWHILLSSNHTDTITTTATTTIMIPTAKPAGAGGSSEVVRYATLWYEDADDSLIDGPVPNVPYHVDLGPLLPFGMMLIISTIIFMLIIFRRWPGLVAGIVAGCLTSISIYLLLLTLKEQKLVYE